MRLLRKPAVHFVALGAVLYLAKAFAFGPVPSAPAEAAIVIDAARVDELQEDWLERTGAPANEGVLDGLIRAEIDDRLLVREARRRGLHRSDPVVQRRLLRNMEFVADADERSAEDRLDEAYRLGMDRSDLVVRRRLIQLLQLEAYGRARVPAPSEPELEAYLGEHGDRFMRPGRLRLQHVYFSRDARGADAAVAARAALEQVGDATVASGIADDVGDPFMFPRDLPSRSERDLAKTFGSDFAARVFELPVGRWSGPFASAYGEHIVFVHERTPAALPELAVVRSEVRESLLAERGKRSLREMLRDLRAASVVRVEGRATPEEAGG